MTLFNQGDSYDNLTGKIIAPVCGLYLFSVYLRSFCSACLNFAIVIQRNNINYVKTHYDNKLSCGSGSVQHIVAFLDVEDSV